MSAVGCTAGDVCDADLSSVEGKWQFSLTQGDEADVVTLDIDADGNVKANSGGSEDLTCKTLQDDLCDLKVECTSSAGEKFSFTLRRQD